MSGRQGADNRFSGQSDRGTRLETCSWPRLPCGRRRLPPAFITLRAGTQGIPVSRFSPWPSCWRARLSTTLRGTGTSRSSGRLGRFRNKAKPCSSPSAGRNKGLPVIRPSPPPCRPRHAFPCLHCAYFSRRTCRFAGAVVSLVMSRSGVRLPTSAFSLAPRANAD